MNPITHALVGWCLAETRPDLGRRERGMIVLAAVVPDLDGFGLPFELATRDSDGVRCFSSPSPRRLVGSRGPDGYEWPIPYLYPFSDRPQLTWSGQWALNAWPNIALTILLLTATFVLAWKRGYSPVGLMSSRADRGFVKTLRARIPRD